MSNYTCVECGKEETRRYLGDRMRAKRLCFSCNFWMRHVNNAEHPMSTRIDNYHYLIGTEPERPGSLHGFGGREFTIIFNDGKVVVTHNLWSQGEIPERFRDRLPNNAKFSQEEQWQWAGDVRYLVPETAQE